MKTVLFKQKGFSLIEVIIAIAIVGIIAASLVSAMQTSSKIMIMTNTQEIAKVIAANEMENVRSQPFADSYTLPPPPSVYSNYVSSVNVSYLQTNEQQITITVSLNGQNIFTLTDYRIYN